MDAAPWVTNDSTGHGQVGTPRQSLGPDDLPEAMCQHTSGQDTVPSCSPNSSWAGCGCGCSCIALLLCGVIERLDAVHGEHLHVCAAAAVVAQLPFGSNPPACAKQPSSALLCPCSTCQGTAAQLSTPLLPVTHLPGQSSIVQTPLATTGWGATPCSLDERRTKRWSTPHCQSTVVFLRQGARSPDTPGGGGDSRAHP